ncbi:hypothetical protein EKL32_25520, partial [Flavobacterium sp. GSN2]
MKSFIPKSTFLSIIFFITNLIFVGTAYGQATLTSDQTDYAPGSTATFTGSGFYPNEVVNMQVLHADETPDSGEDHGSWQVTADASGNFVTTWHVCQDDCLDSTLRASATGQSSGYYADVVFTDANLSNFTVGAQSGTLTYGIGGTVTYTFNVTANNSAGSFTAVMSATSLPSGIVSASFSPTSFTLAPNGSQTVVFTIQTSNTTNVPTGSFTVTATGGGGAGSKSDTATLVISKANQTITWANPADITYGTLLGATQLNATVAGVAGGSSPGALTYTPASGILLTAGASQNLQVSAAATSNYNAATRTVQINVLKANQTITWNNPADITYGTLLGGTQLNASVVGVAGGSTPGALTYTPISGTLLNVGTSQNLVVNAPATTNYNAATKTVQINVNKANQTITWANPSSITYGTLLSATQLNATVSGAAGGSAPGAFTYTPTLGTLLDAGSQILQVSAAATSNYNAATKTVSLTVNKANQNITWADPANITYGALLSATELNATVAGVAGGTLPGALTYTPAAGTLLNAGMNQNLQVNAAGTSNYNAATKTVRVDVLKASQIITWSNPADITYGTLLSATQLNATVTGVVGGSPTGAVTYSPTFGTLLNAGINQTLQVNVGGTSNYNAATKSVLITVNKADATVSIVGYTGVYDAASHGASGTATGVGGADLSAGLNFGTFYTDVPGGNAHWTFTGGTNYLDENGDVSITISKADAVVSVVGYTGVYD